MGIIQGSAYAGAMTGLYAAWYKDYPHSSFHFFNDMKEWKGMDKVGHVYSAYAESLAGAELWRFTGIDDKKRVWLGGLNALAYQMTIEVLDGFSKEWGFSMGDAVANIVGSGAFISQELLWKEQRLQLKWSFHRKGYDDPTLTERSNYLFGRSNPERYLKDYNGQAYWLSVNLKNFFPHSLIPDWLQLSVGTGAEGMFGGYSNVYEPGKGDPYFSRTDIKRHRQWYLAPDIDFTKIRTNKKGLKILFGVMNILKFPAPTIEWSNGKLKGHLIYF